MCGHREGRDDERSAGGGTPGGPTGRTFNSDYLSTSSWGSCVFTDSKKRLGTLSDCWLLTLQTESQLKAHVTWWCLCNRWQRLTHIQTSGELVFFTAQEKQWGQSLPHLHVFLLEDGGLLGEDLIGLDALHALLPLLLLQTEEPLPLSPTSYQLKQPLICVFLMLDFSLNVVSFLQRWVIPHTLMYFWLMPSELWPLSCSAGNLLGS